MLKLMRSTQPLDSLSIELTKVNKAVNQEKAIALPEKMITLFDESFIHKVREAVLKYWEFESEQRLNGINKHFRQDNPLFKQFPWAVSANNLDAAAIIIGRVMGIAYRE